jgi:hypothetical protein
MSGLMESTKVMSKSKTAYRNPVAIGASRKLMVLGAGF